MVYDTVRLAAALMRAALGLAGADGWSRLVAKHDPSLIKIVGCHLNRDTISSGHSDPVSLHAASSVGNDSVAIVHLHTHAAVRKDLDHRTFEFEHFFLSHSNSSTDQ
jgi:hypothetical protein